MCLTTVGEPREPGVVPVAAEDPSPDELEHIRGRRPHVANGEFQSAALTEPDIDWERS